MTASRTAEIRAVAYRGVPAPAVNGAGGLNGRSLQIPPHPIEPVLARYGAITRRVLLGYLPAREPRQYLYHLVPDYILRGGKMLRSSLCIAVCRAFGGTIDDAVHSAAAIELMHTAFLIHDDIEDGSEQRRGSPTLHRRHGVPLAINAGDALSLLSIRPLIENVSILGPRLAWQILAETQYMAEQTVEGQALELGWRQDNACDISDQDYLRMVLKKTCWYTAIHPCRVGAIAGTRRPIDPAFAVRFGLFLGAAFQVQDDVVNLAGWTGRSGKEPCDDLLEGKRTLMLIHLLETLSGREQARLRAILSLSREQREPDQVAWILEKMRSRGSLAFARSYADGLAAAALNEFNLTFGHLPESEDKQFIKDLVFYLVDRAG